MSKKSRRKHKGAPGFNSQGLRDLNTIPSGPSRGIVLEMPPEDNSCEHQQTRIDADGFETCLKCSALVKEF